MNHPQPNLKPVQALTSTQTPVSEGGHELTPDLISVRSTPRLGATARTVVQLVIIAGIALLAFFLGNMLADSVKEEKPFRLNERAFSVETIPAVRINAQPRLALFGTVVASREIALRSRIGGPIVWVHASLVAGGTVARGDVLVRIERFGFEGAVREARANLKAERARLEENETRIRLEESAIKSLELQLEIARRDHRRAVGLQEKGTLAAKTVDDRELLVIQRTQSLDQRSANLDIERARALQQSAVVERLQWRLELAQRNLKDTELVAPFDAVVRDEQVEIGRVIHANDIVANLFERTGFQVKFSLSDAQYGLLVQDDNPILGRAVQVIWNLGVVPIPLDGVVTQKSADISAEKGGVELVATLPSQPGIELLRPGAFVDVSLAGPQYQDVLKVPESAVYDQNTLYSVQNGRMLPHKIRIVGTQQGDLLVRGDVPRDSAIITTRVSVPGKGVRVTTPGELSNQDKALP